MNPRNESGRQENRRAVAYLRASTKRQDLSCDDQLRAIEDYCQRSGLAMARVFRDDGVSGTRDRDRRAGWGEMLSWLEAGHLPGGVVVVWSMDRWSRDFRHGLLAAWAVSDLDVELHTTDGGRVDLESVEGQITGALKLAVAAQESRERSRRVRERKAAHRTAGYWVTKPPLGYRTVGPKGRKCLEPDPEWAPVVLELFERFDRGESYDRLAGWLNRAGRRTRSGRPFTRTTVQRILSGWAYGGIQASRTTGERLPVRAETFIPRDLWERCRERASGTGGRLRPPRLYPLSGLVRCGACGAACHVSSGGGWYLGREYPRRYRCPLVRAGACDNRGTVPVAELEARVLAWWRSLATDDWIEDLARRAVEIEHREALAAAASRAPLEEQLAELERQELRLVDAIRQAGLSPVIERELGSVRDQARQVSERIASMGGGAPPSDLDTAVAELVAELGEVDSVGVLSDRIERIEVHHGRTCVFALGEFYEFET